MFDLDSKFNLHLAIRDLECGLATQILGEYLEPERYGTCDRQVMEVINRADPIFDTNMRPHNLSIESAWVRELCPKYLTTRIVTQLLPPIC